MEKQQQFPIGYFLIAFWRSWRSRISCSHRMPSTSRGFPRMGGRGKLPHPEVFGRGAWYGIERAETHAETYIE